MGEEQKQKKAPAHSVAVYTMEDDIIALETLQKRHFNKAKRMISSRLARIQTLTTLLKEMLVPEHAVDEVKERLLEYAERLEKNTAANGVFNATILEFRSAAEQIGELLA